MRAATCAALAAPLALAWAAPAASAATNADLEKQVITLVNAERRKVGCAGMRTGTALRTAARLHSADMAKYRYFSHTSRDGRSPWDRIRAQKYYWGSAENIAAGQPTARGGRLGLDEEHRSPQEHPQLQEQGGGGRRRAWRDVRHLLDPGLRHPLSPQPPQVGEVARGPRLGEVEPRRRADPVHDLERGDRVGPRAPR